MTGPRTAVFSIVMLCALLWAGGGFAAPDRDKLLTDPGVYGTFAAYSFTDDWARKEGATRIALLTVLKGVVEQHRENIVIDLYLLRGLSDHADILFRVHATEMRDIQKFLVDDSEGAIRIPLGLSYLTARLPLELFAEIVPVVEFAPDTDADVEGGVGIRFYFK